MSTEPINEQKKICFIVNPISGTQSKSRILSAIGNEIDREKYLCEIELTQYPGHAAELAAEKAREGVFAVVAIGGDGTVNEVARSLVHSDTALGIVPCGSGNGLARHMEIPMDFHKALDIINEGLTDVVDYGLLNGSPFFCTCGVGFDAFVSQKFAEAGKRGPLTYIEKTLTEGLKYKPETYEIEIDGNTQHLKAFLIAVGNASQYGNNAYITPQATVTDGLLDVTILEPFTVLDVPSLAIQLFSKTIDFNSRIKTFRCKSMRILRQKDGVAHFDGDPVNLGRELNVSIEHRGLKMIVGEDAMRSEPHPTIFQRMAESFQGIRRLNNAIVDDLTQRNKALIDRGKSQIKKLMDN